MTRYTGTAAILSTEQEMAKGNKKPTRTERKEGLERKRDERCRRNALKKERKIKEYLEHDENFVSFSNQLQALGLKIKDILGDGNCLFRALGDQLEGDHTSHGRHRRETVRYMKEHRDDFEPFVEDNVTFEKHLKELSQLGTYGGNDSIVAFARNNGVNVNIHQLNEPRWVISGSQYSRTGRVLELHLSYHNGDHYSSVRSVNDTDDGPAWPYHSQQSLLPKAPAEAKGKAGKAKQKSRPSNSSSQSVPHLGATCGQFAACDGDTHSLEAEQTVMAATGCKDFAIVAQSLEENSYNVDAAINYVLQLMCIAEEQGFVGDQCPMFNSRTDNFDDDTLTSDTAAPDSIAYQQARSNSETVNKERTSSSENNDERTSTQNSNTDESQQCINFDQTQRESLVTQEPLQEFVENLRDSLTKPECSKDRLPNSKGARPKVTRPKQGHGQVNLSNKKRKELAKQEKKKRRMEERKENASKPSNSPVVTADNSVSGMLPDLGALVI